MNTITEPNLDIQAFHHLDEIDADTWDALSTGQPFQSYKWYAFGEQVMSDCPPLYLLAFHEGLPVARAAFWLARNEPVPVNSISVRKILQAIIRHWPLMICRSPLASTSGLILPENPILCAAALSALCQAGLAETRHAGGSFLIFDFIEQEKIHLNGWPKRFIPHVVSDPGMALQNRWESFEEYLRESGKQPRRNFKKVSQQAEKAEMSLTWNNEVTDIETTLALIRNVEHKHNCAPNPWMRRMLQNLPEVNGAIAEVWIGGQLVGCMLEFIDNGTQILTALGLASDVPNVYFRLLFAGLENSFVHKASLLRWGSGAYKAKHFLGFVPEENNNSIISGTNTITQLITRLAS